MITSRVGQGWYRKALLERWNFRCAVTQCDVTDVLIASHIVPWKDSTNEERLDIDNGILLSPNFDALFDRHLITFDDNGRILVSDKLSKDTIAQLGIIGTERINSLSEGNKKYLRIHHGGFSKTVLYG